MNNPLIDPQSGDCVIATINGVRVTRHVTAVERHGVYEPFVRFDDSRPGMPTRGSLRAWRSWCKRNSAEAVQ